MAVKDCLNCAVDDCFDCAQNLGEYYDGGCCCGGIRPRPDDEDDMWLDEDEWEDDHA